MNSTNQGSNVGQAIGAWVLVFCLGMILLGVTSFLAYLLSNDFSFSSNDARANIGFAQMWLTNSLMGILLLLLAIISLSHSKKTVFKHHFILALWLGVGCYGVIFLASSSQILVAKADFIEVEGGNGCTSLEDQLNTMQQATVPIATNKGTGTAFLISNEGHLLTAYHVVEGANKVYANYTTGEVPISIVKTAPEYDLALLRANKKVGESAYLTSNYAVSDRLYVLGYPGNTFSAGQASLSSGILSRILTNEDLKLNDKNTPAWLEVLQTDAALNPGNSGGAIFNQCGIVGIVSAKSDSRELQEYGIVSEEGISFAISSKTAAKKFNLELK